MSSSQSMLAQLLRDCLPPGRALGLARRVLEDRGEVAELSGVADPADAAARALSEVPLPEVFAALREAAPHALSRIDAVAERVLALDARLGRLLPVCPTLLCFVGREDVVGALVDHPVLVHGGHLHLSGVAGSGRTAVAGQVARRVAERVPVVAWIDGRCESGARQGLLDFAAGLGLPEQAAETTLGALLGWLRENGDWAVVIDDYNGSDPRLSQVVDASGHAGGRVLTVGLADDASAQANVVLPELPAGTLAAVSQRWSRRRAPADAVVDGAGRTHGVAGVAVVSAAWAGCALVAPTVSAAHAVLSPEAAGLLAILGTLAPAPVPAELYTWPLGRPPPADFPLSVEVLVRSPRAAREAARSLVRRAWAHWLGDRLCITSLGARQIRPSWSPAVTAALVLDALLRGDVPLRRLVSHAAWMADDPAVPPPLRRALASHVGRGLLEAGEATEAVDWLQRALAAAEGDPDLPDGALPGLLNDLGVAWRRCGRLEEAKQVLQEALRRDIDAPVPDELAIASTRANLGHVLRELGELGAAQQMYMGALQLRRENLGASHHACAAVAVQLGVVAVARGARADARLAWSEALAALGRRPSASRGLRATVLCHLARLDAEEGRLDRAIERAERAHGLLVAEHGDPEHPEVAAVRDALVGYDHALEDAQKPVPRTR